MCFWTAFGTWCALRKAKLRETETIFLEKGTKEGTASSKYCEQLLGMVTEHKEEVQTLMEKERLNPYGMRKGAATYACSGTMLAPSIPSIARRGKWSIGSVLDCYWHFGSVGDQYLGQILAGLNLNSSSFDVLPPHWITHSPMENEVVRTAMITTFGEVPAQFLPVVLRCFACMVYHSDHLIRQMVSVPGHDFTKLSILHDRDLLRSLQQLVTVEPTEGVISNPTGIPPILLTHNNWKKHCMSFKSW